jgi:hypothetical protein
VETITYNLQFGREEYYKKIKEFTSEVLQASEGFIDSLVNEFQSSTQQNYEKNPEKEECIFEALMLGIFWNNYSSRSLKLDERPQRLLSKLSTLRNEVPSLKEEIDDVRGLMVTMFLINNNSSYDSSHNSNYTLSESFEMAELNKENLKRLLKWLEATGDYNQELKHLRIWKEFLNQKSEEEFALDLTSILMFADWFHENACKNLSQYTSQVNNFLDEKLAEHIEKEDLIFCGRKQVEYHLNMVGAEIMNRTFRVKFEKRPRKAVLIPGCMRYHQNNSCQAIEEKLGLKCSMCLNKCPAASITKKGLEKNFEVYIISHESSAFSQSTEQDRKELGIVGVACVNNLISGGWKSDSLGIPAQCIVLEYVGCQNHWHEEGFPTEINQNELEKILV